jgi:hypothetical protein
VNLREFHADKLGVFKKVFLVLSCKRSQALLYEVELIKVILSWEKWLSIDTFRHHTADGPYVDGFIVVIPADEQFWWSVPASGHIISHDAVGRNTASKT